MLAVVKRFTPVFAIAVLVGVLILAHQTHKMDQGVVQEYYQQLLPQAAGFTPITDKVASAQDSDGSLLGYVGIGSAVGFGGPLLVGVVISPEGDLGEPVVFESRETPSYLQKIAQAGYFSQYTHKKASDPLVLRSDIDGVSGATLSSRAVALSVNDIAHTVATQALGQTPQHAAMPWNLGAPELIAALLFAASLVFSRVKKLARFRVPFLIVSVAVLGFWLNRSLNIAQIQAAFMGFFPSLSQNLLWYIVIVGAFAPVIILGKNLYCTYICPFCGLQEVAHLISRTNIPLASYRKIMSISKNAVLFVALFIGFLTLNPSNGSMEPFGTIFGLSGTSFAWYLLFVLLVASFFFRRFWCYVFCPVGTALDLVASWRRAIGKYLRKRKAPVQAVAVAAAGEVADEVEAVKAIKEAPAGAAGAATKEAPAAEPPAVAASPAAEPSAVAASPAAEKPPASKTAARVLPHKPSFTAIAFWIAFGISLLLIVLVVVERINS